MMNTTPKPKPTPNINAFSYSVSDRRSLGKRPPPITPFKSPSSAPVDWKLLLKDEFDFTTFPIATGSFSYVYKITHKYTGTEYALKQIVKRTYQTEEFELANQVESNHVVKYIKKYQEGKDVAYLIEFEKGGSLDNRIRNEALQESDIKHVMRDILKGLDSIHKNHMVHLDIKPENILLNDSGICKIGDFGKAMKLDFNNDLFNFEYDNIEGDSRYMAPELLNSGELSTKADMYSLGITLLEIATSKEMPSRGEPWQNLREGKIPDIMAEELSEPLMKIIEQLIHPDPHCRPSASELLSIDYFKTKERRFSQPIKPFRFIPVDPTSISLPNDHSFFLNSSQMRESKKRKNEGMIIEERVVVKKLSFGD